MDFDTEFDVTVQTNQGRMFTVTITGEVDCSYSERVEECHGYHTFYDVDDDEFEEKTDELREDFMSEKDSLEICEEKIEDKLNENETVIAFVADLQETA